ncbi:SgrR family transcriptional regulator [Klebsiella grimontii]|nr:SgrR family transcriptional regulator [Klebsiella grimontii]QLO79936.1 SgrR family transcriptional regulator [Klebsiella grimontii]QLP43692.1 SgrR family transcriptional regulator [Klebsiella grimontii]QLU58292.1 SgrR family transcriptional regulator [Klebsiella grimontii]
MSIKSSRLNDLYIRLQRRFHPEKDVFVKVSGIAEVLGCTSRNVRMVLTEMANHGWIQWLPASGRGKQSRLVFLRSSEQISQGEIREMLESGRLAEMLTLVEGDTAELENQIYQHLGTVIEGECKIVRVPWYRSLDRLEPWKPQRRTERHLMRQCFSGLTRYDDELNRVVPDLAHHWVKNDTATQWDFYLRSGLKFSDGSPLQASDIEKCLNAMCRSPVFSCIYSGIVKIQTIDKQRVRFTLKSPDVHFADLLTHTSALIYGMTKGKVIFSGHWIVKNHDDFNLVMKVNPWYHGLRPVIDEVNIMRIESDILDMGRIQVFYQGMSSGESEVSQARIERGSCFLVVDGNGRFAEEEDRIFLNHVLQPVDILKNSSHRKKMNLALSVAQGLLPGWYHRILDIVPPIRHKMYRELTLATFEQPELAKHAEGIVSILERYGIKCRIVTRSFQEFFSSPPANIDLWLTNFVLDDANDCSLNNWLQSDPILARCGNGWNKEKKQVAKEIRNGDIPCEKALEQLVRQFTFSRWFIPLVYHRVDHEQIRHNSAFSNELGWVNFSDAWFDIR